MRRAGGSRSEHRRFLVYCEGECTEDQYFKGLRQELRSLPVTICIGGDHGEPKSLVRSAIKHKERAAESAADRHTPYDEVWCVVDVEAPRQHPSLDEAIALARKAGVRIALSNPCFELWILLHLKEVSAYQTSAALQSALERRPDAGTRSSENTWTTSSSVARTAADTTSRGNVRRSCAHAAMPDTGPTHGRTWTNWWTFFVRRGYPAEARARAPRPADRAHIRHQPSPSASSATPVTRCRGRSGPRRRCGRTR